MQTVVDYQVGIFDSDVFFFSVKDSRPSVRQRWRQDIRAIVGYCSGSSMGRIVKLVPIDMRGFPTNRIYQQLLHWISLPTQGQRSRVLEEQVTVFHACMHPNRLGKAKVGNT